MHAEAAGAVMVLAVDVRRDHAPQGHELRSRNHRRKKAASKEGRDDIREQDAGLGRQPAARRIEAAEAVELAQGEAGLHADGGVPIGATIAARDEVRKTLLQADDLEAGPRLDQLRLEARVTAPAGHFHALTLRSKVKFRSRRYLAKLPIVRPMTAPRYLLKSVPPIFQNATSKLQKTRVIATLNEP